MPNKIEITNVKDTQYYINLLMLYDEYFKQEDLLALLISTLESIKETNPKKLKMVYDLIENKVKELEGCE